MAIYAWTCAGCHQWVTLINAPPPDAGPVDCPHCGRPYQPRDPRRSLPPRGATRPL